MGDHVDVDVTGPVDHVAADVRAEQALPAVAATHADDQLGGVDPSGEVEQRLGDVLPDDRVEAAPQALHQVPLPRQRVRAGAGQPVAAHHVDGEQLAASGPPDDARATADQRVALRAAGERHHDAFAGRPGLLDAVLGPVALQPLVDPVGHPQQGELAQRGQVPHPEVVRQGGVHLLRGVDVAVGHPTAQRLRGHVLQLDLVGPADHLVGDGLALLHPGDRRHHVVERLQVLDVHGGDHVDAGVQQLLDVLPPLLVARAGDVGVRELVDEGDLRRPGQDGRQVHLGEQGAAVGDLLAGDHLQPVDQCPGQCASVVLHEPDHHVGAPFEAAVPLAEHGVRLAHPGGRPEVDPQPSACHAVSVLRRSALHSQERQVQLQHVHRRLAQEAQVATVAVGIDQGPRLGGSSPRACGDPRDLLVGVGGADVGVQARTRTRSSASGGTLAGSTPSSAAAAARRSCTCLRRSELFGPRFGRRGGGRVVAVGAGSGGSRLEPLRQRAALGVGEVLPDQARSDDVPAGRRPASPFAWLRKASCRRRRRPAGRGSRGRRSGRAGHAARPSTGARVVEALNDMAVTESRG